MEDKTKIPRPLALVIRPESLFALAVLVPVALILLLTSCAGANSQSDLSPSDPLTVVRQFTDAMGVGNVNQAMALFADDVAFADQADQIQYGKPFVQQWLTQELPRQMNAQLADISISGNAVSWTVRISAKNQSTLAKSAAVVQGGKITYFSALD